MLRKDEDAVQADKGGNFGEKMGKITMIIFYDSELNDCILHCAQTLQDIYSRKI